MSSSLTGLGGGVVGVHSEGRCDGGTSVSWLRGLAARGPREGSGSVQPGRGSACSGVHAGLGDAPGMLAASQDSHGDVWLISLSLAGHPFAP